MRLTLYLRGRVWWARGSESSVKFRRSTRQTNQRKARLIADRWERELADPETYRANKATVESAAERWMKEITVAMKPETVRFYKTKIGHVLNKLGSVKLAKLTHDKVLAFTQARLAEGGHPHTIHRELTALRLTLKSAQRAGEFGRDPKSVIPRFKSGYEPLKDFVEPETIWAAIAHLPSHRGAAVAWCIATACDFGHIFSAERDDVAPYSVLVRGTKTSTRQRSVPRIRVMEPFLRHALAYAEPEPAKLLFRPWGKMGRDVRRACRRAGVPEFTARTLRRSAATWMVRAGVPYEVAAKFLGHGSTLMLQRVYGQLAPKDAARLIDERLS
jgi:integrase